MEPTSQPTIVHLKQATGPVHNDRNHFPIGILNSGIDVPRYGRNIYNQSGMKPQVPIVTTIPESSIEKNCNIFYSVRNTSDLVCRVLPWHVTIKSETVKLVEHLMDNNIFKNTECKINSEVEKVGRNVNWNHTDSILNWNK